ncbi:MAG: uroporphyrinogen-III synthase [Rhodospirillaceae bacterium]|nr:uroporphyrinogen-III synthase [Rhodospirillaceae bacterium]|tara:strand:+ start:12613 stop:13332 length:720 start_codon:yes stop_codon:yes gene_type:complete
MRLLLTRPHRDSERLATELIEHGVESVIAPLLTIEPVACPVPAFEGVQALVLTSANGAVAIATWPVPFHLPVMAVGAATAEAAREQGMTDVTTADGDVDSLAALIRNRLDPTAGRLVHVAGTAVVGDLAAMTVQDGFEIERIVAYDAVTAETLPRIARDALAGGLVDGAAFFSPRTAATFVRLVVDAGLQPAMRTVAAFCLSRAVDEALAGLAWTARHVADRPDRKSLIALISAAQGRR